ncbi:MAG: hypothetical protein M1135_01470 [Candidatus Omnitrophica bacterium]|nr:hypothetical protein [Candidatus Omnitrophota bacterium]
MWNRKYPADAIESPCLIDYFVYRIIGKDFCKETLYIFKCEAKKHEFKWHSNRNKTCQICYKNKVNNRAIVVKKMLPCMDAEGSITIEKI